MLCDMNAIIQYKPIRHGYARINNEGKLIITIPNKLKNNEWFKNILLEKGNQLLARYQKKTHIQASDKESVLLFGERVPTTDIAPNTKKIPQALKEILQEYAEPILDHYSEKLGIKYRNLTIRKTKSKRWSCTSDQNISLNLNLVHLQTKFIQYVIIHEVCHLKIKNHSSKFWALVETFLPNYKVIRKEMKKIVLK